MSDPTGWQGQPERQGLPCPECGALRAADNTPSCACARRAADALRDTRTAEAAAAEDFDPLRIRPYVEIGEGGDVHQSADVHRGADVHQGGQGAVDMTMPLRTVPAADETVQLRAVPADATTALPSPLTPMSPLGAEPSTTDLSLFETSDRDDAYRDDEDASTPRGRRRRRALLLATTGAVVTVVTAAGFASGLFSYEKPARDSAAPEEVRAAVPEVSDTEAASVSSSASGSPSPSASSASPSASASESASPSASAGTSASPSASASAEPSPAVSSAEETASAGPDDGTDGDGGGQPIAAPVLRRGDSGPEVTELQLRLSQLRLYNQDANGVFDQRLENAVRNYQWYRNVKTDGYGVYGAATRQSLESETSAP
ncbi:peptidoglycan-binding domain-containing protein [Streptomyces sp. CAI-85]|uniref:peptidoglycan-binding domain-containing protein n=1 Tax=Streptomyces sp. CAI-85 TaxID=1472662 RepID=UPI002815686A|nr:peptidoglycan-binding domain-containing protein [Streptomyces sp. CAI-85]